MILALAKLLDLVFEAQHQEWHYVESCPMTTALLLHAGGFSSAIVQACLHSIFLRAGHFT